VADRLKDYRRKRDASTTPEPGGEAASASPSGSAAPEPGKPAGAKRYVVQEHHATRLHWDLRLEHDGVAVSWAVPNGIPEDPKDNRLAVHTEDHPLEYLEFEGEIPKGSYGAGSMRIWDRGTYEEHKFDDDKVEVTFHGERLNGRYGLFPLKKRKGVPPGKDWMIHRMDPPADPTRKPMPSHLAPMLARAGSLPSDDDRWAYEIKWDGVRALVYSEPGRIRFESRNGNDITDGYPELRALNRALSSHSAILDGEIVAFDEHGRPSFGRLQSRMHLRGDSAVRRRAKEVPVAYIAFDLLWLDGHALFHLTYAERRELLKDLELEGAAWRTPDHVVGDGAAVLAASVEAGLEGVVAKKLDSLYEPGRRSPCWLKVKNVRREDVVVGGWVPGSGKRTDRIGALLVGVEQDGALRFAGRVGTGFTEAELDRLSKVLERRDDSPFTASDGPKPPRESVFVEPTRVAEVEFTEWTSDGVMRHPSYKGLREEAPQSAFLDAGTPVRDGVEVKLGGRTLKLTNLDKVLYPEVGFTKRDVIEYLVHVAPAILPHLEGRPLTRKRYPNGVDDKFFFEKQCPSHRPDWVKVAPIELSKKTVEFCVCDDLPTLVWLGNLAALELHTSLSRAVPIERPTAMVFDLDPGPPATIVECCRVALILHGMFENLGLKAFPKTSGNKGMQLYVPLNVPDATYEKTKGFSRAVAETLEAGEPDLVVSRMAKALRGGKVFIDYSQNDEHKTTVNVYSLRARERPTVSTPLEWDEVRACLDSRDPSQLVFDAARVIERVAERGDLFAPVLSLVQDIPALG
jgi:bifunctional non-homologous end joining protein LigD